MCIIEKIVEKIIEFSYDRKNTEPYTGYLSGGGEFPCKDNDRGVFGIQLYNIYIM